MASKSHRLAVALIVSVGFPSAANAARARTSTSMTMASRASLRFHQERERMRREREESIAYLTNNTTIEAAYRILKHNPKATVEVLSLVEKSLRSHFVSSGASLRAHAAQNSMQHFSPSSQLTTARNMLNAMLGEVLRKYDRQTAQCQSFFKKQCGLLETCRQDVSSANSEAADWRGKVLEAQKEINICETRIPRLEESLQASDMECNKRLVYLDRDLKVVMGDIDVMTQVLKLTQCGRPGFIQLNKVQLVKCKDRCHEGSFVSVTHGELQQKLASVQSAATRERIQKSLMELAEKSPTEEALLQAHDGQPSHSRNHPLPQLAIPQDPCEGIDYGTGLSKGTCSIRANPECQHLQNKFLSIQSETIDKRDELLKEIAELTATCKRTKKTLEDEIQAFEIKLGAENTRLAEATSGENSAAEEGRMKDQEHGEMEKQMHQTRSACSAKMRQLESEECALKKIRGELFRMNGDTHPLFQDCEVADWEAQECSVACGGGTQELLRTVVVPQSGGGVECPPLKMRQACNEQPCPVDCVLSEWSGFSACSAECGGGVSERSRSIKVHPKYEGEPCGDLTDTVACNMQSCDRDCVLSEWTEWSSCSKECDTGSRVMHRKVLEGAVGRGKCPEFDSKERLVRESCNTDPCPREATAPLVCLSKVDVVLLLDGSGSMGSEGFDLSKKFAKLFVSAFKGAGADAQIALILFSGPKYWDTYTKCTSGSSEGLNFEEDCGIKVVQHFSPDMGSTESNIDGLAWPAATTLTSVALELASAELALGRRGSKKIVLVVTDGEPLSPRATGNIAHRLRKWARLMFVPVAMTADGLNYMQEWASHPPEENVLNVRDFADLNSVNTVDSLISDMCEKVGKSASTTPEPE